MGELGVGPHGGRARCPPRVLVESRYRPDRGGQWFGGGENTAETFRHDLVAGVEAEEE